MDSILKSNCLRTLPSLVTAMSKCVDSPTNDGFGIAHEYKCNASETTDASTIGMDEITETKGADFRDEIMPMWVLSISQQRAIA